MKNPKHFLLLLALCLTPAYVAAQIPMSSGTPESMVSPAPEVHSEDDGHDHESLAPQSG